MGVALLASGCSRIPAGRKPAAVYVSADKLVAEQPQWDDEVAMDRQIDYLKRFTVRQPQQTLISAVRFPPRPVVESTRNVSALESSIEKRLNTVYEHQKAALAARLARQHRETRAAGVLADQNAILASGDADMKRVLDVEGVKIRNLDIRLQAYDALLRAYAAQGWDTKDLPKARKAVADDLVAANDKAWAQMTDILQGLRTKLGARADEETAATLKWMRENSQAQTDLELEIGRQKALLLAALNNIGKPIGIDAGSGPAAEAISKAVPAVPVKLPQPELQNTVQSIEDRRAALVEYLGRATRATVQSAAGRRGLKVEFEPRPGLPDKTEDYRAVVRMAPTRPGVTP
ncbi:MAG TPA: hypothetical protein VGM51_16145 [Armatimonadota bacterium]|jgi:hypothetical protein